MSNRIQKVNQLIKEELSRIILKETDFLSRVLITLTRVETSSNLSQSKVYISVMPEKKIKNVVRSLNKQVYHLQQKLNQRLNMRPVPKIILLEEKETAKAGKIEEILEKLRKKEEKKGGKMAT